MGLFAQRPGTAGFPPRDHPAEPVVPFQGAELAVRSHGPCVAALLKGTMEDLMPSLTMPRPTPAKTKTLSLSRVLSVQWLASFPTTRPWTSWEGSTRALLSLMCNSLNKLQRELLQRFKQMKGSKRVTPLLFFRTAVTVTVNGWKTRAIIPSILHPRDRSIPSAESLCSGCMPEFTITACSPAVIENS